MQDVNTGHWWLAFTLNKGRMLVGYWPKSLFSQVLGQGATILQWGGEVRSANVKKTPHTTTTMGSGEFAGVVHGWDAYIEHIGVRHTPNQPWMYPLPQNIGVFVDEKNCYSVQHHVEIFEREPVLYFGGPGQNRLCP